MQLLNSHSKYDIDPETAREVYRAICVPQNIANALREFGDDSGWAYSTTIARLSLFAALNKPTVRDILKAVSLTDAA